MTFRFSIILVAVLFFSFSCNTTQDIPSDLSTLKKEVEMDKNPCFGTCPYYTLTIYEGGIASFEGKKDVEKLGLYTKILKPKEYKGVQNAFESSKFFDLDDNYPSGLADLPKTSISYYKNGDSKTVTSDEISRPSIVMGLDNLLTQIAESGGWQLKQATQGND
jgi:hypothetical protein